MLESGLTYNEITQLTGRDTPNIFKRNRDNYHVDIYEAFRLRVERNDIPKRMPKDPIINSWLTGFTDAEGYFGISINNTPNRPNPRLVLRFSVALRRDDIQVLEFIQSYLKVGVFTKIGKSGNNRAVGWTVKNIKDLAEVIVPLFSDYPPCSKKYREFQLWKQAVMLRYTETLGGRSRIATSDNSKELFRQFSEQILKIRHPKNYDTEHVPQGLITNRGKLLPKPWFVGFIDGDGSFGLQYVAPSKSRGRSFRLGIRAGSRIDDANMIYGIQNFLGIGTTSIEERTKRKENAKPFVDWSCSKIQDVYNILIPIFSEYPLRTKKQVEFLLWKELVSLRFHEKYVLRKRKASDKFVKLFLDSQKEIRKKRRGDFT
jgi:hypothetical protein